MKKIIYFIAMALLCSMTITLQAQEANDKAAEKAAKKAEKEAKKAEKEAKKAKSRGKSCARGPLPTGLVGYQ